MDGIEVKGAGALFEIGPIVITETILSLIIVTAVLMIAGVLLGRNLQKRPGKMQVLVEKGVTMITDLTVSAMGKHNIHWTPFMGCLFLCSICGSYIGLTGFLRPATADINCTATWALMVSFIIWANNIKNDGIVKFLKNYINPMNIISDLSQPLSTSFRHFSNVSVGTIISTILYTALSGLSAVLIGLVSGNGWMMSTLVLAIGFALALLWARPAKKIMRWIIAGVTIVLGLFGLLESMGILSQVPVFTYGIPAVLSVYFDFFSGFIQALVFTLLSMVYIGISQPEPAKAEAE